MLSSFRAVTCRVITGMALLIPALAQAQVTTWLDINSNWQAAANWDNTVPDTATETAVFGGGTETAISRGGGVSNLGNLTFDSSAISRTITGNRINLYGVSGIGILNDSANTQTITSGIDLFGDQEWQLNGGNSILSGSTYLKTTDYDLTKTGTGTLTFGGSTSNQNSNSTIFVNEGTLALAKTSGDAISGTNAVLNIGDGAGTDTVRLDASNQIQDSSGVLVAVNSSGVLDLNNFNERLASLNLTGGTVTTGTGILTIGNLGGTGISSLASASSASISGNLALESYESAISVADGSAASDLVISANISGNRILKTGSGTLVLSGNNTFADSGNTWDQALTIQGGTVQVSANANLGNANNNISLQGGTLRASGTFSTGANRIIKADSGGGTIEVTGSHTLTHTGTITGSNTLTKTGSGTLTLNHSSANQMAPGRINLNAGTLLLGSSDQIANGTNMTLSGGTFNTGGFSETLGTLTLTASSVIDMGTGSSILRFANSSAESWTGTLSIYNWTGTPVTGGGTDQLYFGTNTSGLTTTQLSQIRFYSDNGSTFLGDGFWATSLNGEVVIPEAKVWWSALLLVALVLFMERQRLRRLLLHVKMKHGHQAVPPC